LSGLLHLTPFDDKTFQRDKCQIGFARSSAGSDYGSAIRRNQLLIRQFARQSQPHCTIPGRLELRKLNSTHRDVGTCGNIRKLTLRSPWHTHY
jgi:hypothetical protein